MRPMPRTSWSSSYFSTSGASAAINRSPRTAGPATRSSSSSTCRVARPATMASWLRENVDEWTTARSIEL